MANYVSTKKKKPLQKIIIFALLLLYAIILFVPFYVLIADMFTSYDELQSFSGFVWWPKKFSFEGFSMIFGEDPWGNAIPTILLGFINTMWQTLIPLVVGLLVAGFSAFCFSKLKFPGKEKLFLFNIATMTMPLGVFGMVGFFFWQELGMSETVWPLILPGLFGAPTTVFFLRMYFDSMSNEVIEAAKIDGAGILKIYFSIMMPLAVPAFLSQFIFGFVGGYNSYAAPLLYLINDTPKWPLQLVMSQITGIYNGGQLNVLCSAAFLCMLPLIILYAFLQKWFLEGIAVGGGKE